MVSLSLLTLVASALAAQAPAAKQTSPVAVQIVPQPSHVGQAQAAAAAAQVSGAQAAAQPSHVAAQAAQVSGARSSTQVDAINYGLEAAAIQIANYRNPSVSHEEAVELARKGLALYSKQAPINDLVSKALGFYNDNSKAISSGDWTPTAEDGLRAAKAFESANKNVAKSASFNELNTFLQANLNKFDLGAGMKDVKRLAAVNPENARKAIKAVQDRLSSNTVHQETYDTLLSMAKSFAAKYNIDQDKFSSHFDMIANAIYEA